MFYDFAVSVPANTLESAPVEQTLKLTHGIIHKVEVQFPIGTQALAHCKILEGGHQFLPTNPEGSFASDGYVIPIDEYYEFYTEPYTLKVRCWNDDDTYQHTITIRVGIMESKVAIFLMNILTQMAKFLKLVGIGG